MLKTKNNLNSASQGQILIVSLIFVLIPMALSGVLISLIFSHTQTGRAAYAKEQALQIAEAGIDRAIYEINQPGGGSYTGGANTSLGQGEFSVTVADVGNTKIIAIIALLLYKVKTRYYFRGSPYPRINIYIKCNRLFWSYLNLPGDITTTINPNTININNISAGL